MVEAMKIMVTSFRRFHACTECAQPCSRPPPTHTSTGDSWTLTGKSGSALCGHCSFLLGPSAHRVLFVQESISQSCVSSGSFMVGLMATSSKRAYAIPKSAAPRAPIRVTVHCWPVPPQEMLIHSFVSVTVGSLDLVKNNKHMCPLKNLYLNGFTCSCWKLKTTHRFFS